MNQRPTVYETVALPLSYIGFRLKPAHVEAGPKGSKEIPVCNRLGRGDNEVMQAFGFLCAGVVLLGGVDARAALSATELKRPASFPHRIWAACDFEGRTHTDYGWFGKVETNTIPKYPGNRTALRAKPGPYGNHAAIMGGINPVPGPRMGKENWLYLRYFLKGGTDSTLQHFSLTTEDNWHVKVSGLTTNAWADLAVNFTAHAKRNDGSAKGFSEGERMDGFKMFAGSPNESTKSELLMDDVLFFANDPALPPEPEPFPGASFSSRRSTRARRRSIGQAT